jgi:type II secretory pathway component GspD/PulD (secretin)
MDVSFGVNNGIDMSISGASRPSRFPFNLGPGSFAANLTPGRIDDNTIIAPLTSSIVTPGTLDFSATSLAIKLVKNDQTAQFVQAPKLTTVDHREATIFVGETIRYAQAEAAASQSGGLTLSIREADHSPVDTGFQLLVIPQVVPSTNKILMTVIPQARTLSGTSDPNQPGFDLFTVGAGSAGSGSISLPRVASETVVTNMMLENGQTGIVGGLVQSQKSRSETKVPWLGDLPILGALFRSTTDSESERGLLVFITPWIVGSSEKVEDHLKGIIEQYQQNSGREWEMFAGASS